MSKEITTEVALNKVVGVEFIDGDMFFVSKDKVLDTNDSQHLPKNSVSMANAAPKMYQMLERFSVYFNGMCEGDVVDEINNLLSEARGENVSLQKL